MSDVRSNILIFCTDEQRGDYLGCMGDPHLRTPNIDRIAAEGMLFRNCYTSSPVCMPARATMLTGLTNRASGVRTQGVSLSPDVPTLPGVLAAAGYRTHSVGKLHHRPWGGRTIKPDEATSENPERRIYWDWPGHWQGEHYSEFPDNYYGFQTLDVANGHVDYIYGDYVTWLETHHPGAYAGYRTANPGPLSIDPDLHYNAWIADRSIDFITQHQADAPDQPFYLWCSFPDPHEPFGAVGKWADAYKDADIELPQHTLELSPDNRSTTMAALGLGMKPADPHRTRECIRQTYGMISHVDEHVGRVLDCLDKEGIADNTVVMYVSDHGEAMGEHGFFYKSLYPYDGHAHIPFVIKAPGGVRGKVVDDVVSLLDMVPTALDLAGVGQPKDRFEADWQSRGVPLPPTLPGEVLTPVVAGDALPQRKNALIEYDSETCQAFDIVQYRSLVTNDWKLVFYAPTNETMLFDRRSDPNELKNLADDPAYQHVLVDMFQRLTHELVRTDRMLPRFMGC